MSEAVEVQKVTLYVTGEWYTEHLRSLWSEHSELKAINSWCDSFPENADMESIKDYCLPLCMGKTKLQGRSNDPDGLMMIDDDVTTHRGMPLFDSIEDVLRLKRNKLYLSELDLTAIRMNKRFIPEDEYTEDYYVNNFSELFNEITNLCMMFQINPIPYTNTSTIIPSASMMEKYSKFTEWYIKERLYFKNKYGSMKMFEEPTHYKYVFAKEEIDARRQEHAEIKSAIRGKAAVDLFLKKEQTKDVIKPENIKKTKLSSGWLSPDGAFYGCGFQDHINFSEELVEHLKLTIHEEKKKEYSFKPMPEQILEALGWVKISSKRYFWNMAEFVLTTKQKMTIQKLMDIWEQQDAVFGLDMGKRKTFEDAIEENITEYNFYRRTK